MSATLTANQAELVAQANAMIEAQEVRRLGHLEAARTLFSSVSGSGRTDAGIALGRVLSDSLAEEKNIPAKKKWIEEVAKQICGNYSDDRKLVDFIKLYHVSLRLPTLKQVGLTWALKMVSAMKTGFDWKSVTDNMSSVQIERAQFILPLLHAGTDGIGCDEKGNPSRQLWAKVIGYYLEHGELEVAETTPEATPEETTPELEATPATPRALTIENLATVLNDQNEENILALTSLLSQETIQRLFDAIDSEVTTRKANNNWK